MLNRSGGSSAGARGGALAARSPSGRLTAAEVFQTLAGGAWHPTAAEAIPVPGSSIAGSNLVEAPRRRSARGLAPKCCAGSTPTSRRGRRSVRPTGARNLNNTSLERVWQSHGRLAGGPDITGPTAKPFVDPPGPWRCIQLTPRDMVSIALNKRWAEGSCAQSSRGFTCATNGETMRDSTTKESSAKTGTLNFVSRLAGYIRNGQWTRIWPLRIFFRQTYPKPQSPQRAERERHRRRPALEPPRPGGLAKRLAAAVEASLRRLDAHARIAHLHAR